MRHLFVLALSAMVALSWSTDAEAGKKKNKKNKKNAQTEQVEEAPAEEAEADGEAAAEADAEKAEEEEGIEILDTGLEDVDSVFGKAKEPVDTITQTRLGLDRMNADLNAALGLKDGTPLADAIADLKTKAEGKLSVAMEGTLPKVSAADGVPENVSAAVDALNSGVDELNAMVPKLGELPEQFAALVQEAEQFTDVETLKGIAANPIQAGKALPKIKKNFKALGDAKEEATELVQSVDTLKTSLTTLGG